MDDYKRETLTICIGLYALAFVYALLQALYRCWLERERAEAREQLETRYRETERLATRERLSSSAPRKLFQSEHLRFTGKDLTVSQMNRSRLDFVTQNLTFALFLRTIWLSLTVLDVAPKPIPGEETCGNAHTFISAGNRLCQLLFFTSYLSMIGYIANVLRSYDKAKRERVGLTSEREIASALAQSTNRRRPGETMVAIPDLYATSVPNQGGVSASSQEQTLEDQQGFNAICSLFCMLLTPDVVQLLLNFWVYVIISILLVVQWFECDPVKFTSVDHAQTITIAFFFTVLSFMNLRYGYRLLRVLQEVHNPIKWRFVANMSLITVISVFLFLVRGVLFLLEPLFSYTLTGVWEQIMYPWFFYALPELLPSLVLLHLMTPRARRIRLNGPEASTPLIPEASLRELGDQEGNSSGQVVPDLVPSSPSSSSSETGFGSIPRMARRDDDVGQTFWA